MTFFKVASRSSTKLVVQTNWS